MFFYSDTSVRSGIPVDVSKMNGSAQYLKHLKNMLVLCFFAQTGTFKEKQQALVELKIADRKLTYWRRHPNFSIAEVIKGIPKLREQWKDHPEVTSRIREPVESVCYNDHEPL